MIISNTRRIVAVFTAFLFVFSSSRPIFGAETDASQAAEKSSPVPVVDSEDYPILRIGSGDLLSIFVYGENGVTGSGGSAGVMDQLPTDYQVDSDGIIVFPFLGRVKLAGLTPAQASEKIGRLLSKPRRVSVLIKYSSAFWVLVLGDVGHPGKFQITGRPTLLSALGDAGGPMTDADLGAAILIHDKVKTSINLNKYLKDTSAQIAAPYIYPGDTLMVQKSPWPSIGEWAIIASILASGAIIAVELGNIKN